MNKLYAIVSGMIIAATPLAQAQTSEKAPTPRASQAEKPAPGGAAHEMPTVKPGPEHQELKKLAGTWDATVEMLSPPGGPASKGTETNTLIGDGLWVVSDFKAEMMQKPFQGHGVWGWDPAKKKYVGTWVDTMSTGLTLSEGTFDPATKTMTDTMEMPGPDGKPMKVKSTTEWKDADTRVFTMFMGDTPSMRITYKRKK